MRRKTEVSQVPNGQTDGGESREVSSSRGLSEVESNCIRPRANLMCYLDLIQWPAMVVTVAAAWYVASTHARRRNIGFWLFITSNLLWIIWGIHAHAYALTVLQVCLAAMNIRGAKKSDKPAPAAEH